MFFLLFFIIIIIIRSEPVIISIDQNPTTSFPFNVYNGFCDWDTWKPEYDSSLIYVRWYYDAWEPDRGNFNFENLDTRMEMAKDSGKLFAFRIMGFNHGENNIPTWLRERVGEENGYWSDEGDWIPNYNNEVFISEVKRQTQALGERYNGNPMIAFIDIGIVGYWGEWHISGIPDEYREVLNPTEESAKKYIDMYFDAFPDTQLVMLIGAKSFGDALEYGVKRGAGIRADCLGDYHVFSETWNHMENSYAPVLEDSWMNETWKTAPIVFETCKTLQGLYDTGNDIKKAFEVKALEWHTTNLNNKGDSYDDNVLPTVETYMKTAGYRFYMSKVTFSIENDLISIQSTWNNVGVAPIYIDAQIQYSIIVDGLITNYTAPDSLRTLLPDEDPLVITSEFSIIQPDNPENTTIKLGLFYQVEHNLTFPISLAIRIEQEDDGFYQIYPQKICPNDCGNGYCSDAENGLTCVCEDGWLKNSAGSCQINESELRTVLSIVFSSIGVLVAILLFIIFIVIIILFSFIKIKKN